MRVLTRRTWLPDSTPIILEWKKERKKKKQEEESRLRLSLYVKLKGFRTTGVIAVMSNASYVWQVLLVSAT